MNEKVFFSFLGCFVLSDKFSWLFCHSSPIYNSTQSSIFLHRWTVNISFLHLNIWLSDSSGLFFDIRRSFSSFIAFSSSFMWQSTTYNLNPSFVDYIDYMEYCIKFCWICKTRLRFGRMKMVLSRWSCYMFRHMRAFFGFLYSISWPKDFISDFIDLSIA